MKKGDKKKTNRSYADENPLNPRFKKWKAKEAGPGANPYKGKKSKKMSKSEKENPGK